MLDTVRADRLSLYGYGRPTSPELEGLRDRVSRAVVYPVAFSTGSWTLPAHGSLFTGKTTTEHQMHLANGGQHGQGLGRRSRTNPRAQTLTDSGYRATGLVANTILTTVGGIDAGVRELGLRASSTAVSGTR